MYYVGLDVHAKRSSICILAKLLYLDEVPAVHVPSLDVRAWRGLITYRRKLVGRRAAVKTQMRAHLRGLGLVAGVQGGRGLWTRKDIIKRPCVRLGNCLPPTHFTENICADPALCGSSKCAFQRTARRAPGERIPQLNRSWRRRIADPAIRRSRRSVQILWPNPAALVTSSTIRSHPGRYHRR